MKSKTVPFIFNHINISTPKIEEVKWPTILDQHQSTANPISGNLVVVGNELYSMDDRAEADRLMLVNNNNKK